MSMSDIVKEILLNTVLILLSGGLYVKLSIYDFFSLF